MAAEATRIGLSDAIIEGSAGRSHVVAPIRATEQVHESGHSELHTAPRSSSFETAAARPPQDEDLSGVVYKRSGARRSPSRRRPERICVLPTFPQLHPHSEERRVGKELVRTCRSGGSPKQ